MSQAIRPEDHAREEGCEAAVAVLLILSSLAFAQRTVCTAQSDGSYICQPDSPASAKRLAIVGVVVAGIVVVAWAIHHHHKRKGARR